ncbi:MAG: hypothetical protein SGI88_02345 [Candidatus Hydrogenedentes bacterium]|nr:hypothetical protein [Candidatus Hydrogenedentota bacterium]
MSSLSALAMQMTFQKRCERTGRNVPTGNVIALVKPAAYFADSNPLLACAVDVRSLTKQFTRRAR